MERLKLIRNNWPLLAICSFYIYLAVHALSGNQGLASWVDYENDIAHYTLAIQAAQDERARLEARTDALRASHLDVDTLDFKAREQVFLSRPEELTIWLDQTP